MSPLQFLFLGTATSTGLPLTPCLTLSHDYPDNFMAHVPHPISPAKGSAAPAGHYDPAGPWPRNVKCACCRNSVDPDVPEGWKNKRGNTSAIVRRKAPDGKWKNILVDCGKTFLEQARTQFPKWDVKTIDAVLLTHGHADAFFGLDDLREWCIRQGYAIPVYLNQPTYNSVGEAFPYLIDKNKASGGGDVPALQWNVIDDFSSFEVCGIPIKSYPVEHGVYFTDPVKNTSPATKPAPSDLKTKAKPYKPQPFICLAFMFDDKVLYMADVSEIPDETWDRLLGRKPIEPVKSGQVTNGQSTYTPPTPVDTPPRQSSPSSSKVNASTPTSSDAVPNLPVLVVDALWPLKSHLSHFSFAQALQTAQRLRPESTFLLGSTHPTTHFMWEEACRSLVGEEGQRPDHPDARNSEWLIGKLKENGQFKGEGGIYNQWQEWNGRVEPAWDGLLLEIGDTPEDGKTWKEYNGKKYQVR